MIITDFLERNAREFPNDVALVEINPEIKEDRRVTWKEFELIENYMLQGMEDVAHDTEHVYRVLYSALDIAHHTGGRIDHDVLICACL